MGKYLFFLSLLTSLTLTGCQQNDRRVDPQHPILIGQKKETVSSYAHNILENSTRPKTEDARIKKMELKTQKEIERIKAEKELEIARLKAEAEKSKALSEKEMTLKKIEAKLEEIVGNRKMVGWVIALSALFFFVLLWVVYKLVREYYLYRRRIEEEKIRHEKEMQEKELQARLAEKMFEALSSGHLNEEQQNRLLESLGHGNRELPFKKEE